MIFVVSRVSDCSDDAPCEEAKLRNIVYVETRTLCSPEEFDAKFSKSEGKWLSVGTNHRLNDKGFITRDNGFVPAWTIEINTLEELITFNEKYGNIVITEHYRNRAYKEIEIYDWYRE